MACDGRPATLQTWLDSFTGTCLRQAFGELGSSGLLMIAARAMRPPCLTAVRHDGDDLAHVLGRRVEFQRRPEVEFRPLKNLPEEFRQTTPNSPLDLSVRERTASCSP